MRIEKCLNATLAEIVAKRNNIVIEINLGNKYFLDEAVLKEYITWALTNSEHILLVIPDELQAINYRVTDGYREEQALAVALRKGREMDNRIQKVIKEFFLEQKERLITLHWTDIKKSSAYANRRNLLNQAFKNDPAFKAATIQCVTEQTSKLKRAFKPADYEGLAVYLLDELPILLAGVAWEKVQYNVIPCPGISGIHHLAVDLQNGVSFSKITQALGLTTKTIFVEAFAE